MSYDFEYSLPFEYKQYKSYKKVEFTDDIKERLDDFYSGIMALDKNSCLDERGRLDAEKTDALVSELSRRYSDLRESYISPAVREKYNYKNLAYTQEEVRFIFICSYWLIDRLGLPQSSLCKIFGIKKNKFSKMDIFPARCHDAFTKLAGEENMKSMLPNNKDSLGIQIAKVVNERVQSVYACSAFVGVTNDLDVFANISSTDRKRFILVQPESDSAEKDKYTEFNKAYAAFLFATGNNLDNTKEYASGKIKEKIINLIKMRNSDVLQYSGRMKGMLDQGDGYSDYILAGQNVVFEKELYKYREQMEMLDYIKNNDEVQAYYTSDEDLDSIGLDADRIAGIDFNNYCEVQAYLERNVDSLRKRLLRGMSYAAAKKFNAEDFIDYKNCLQSVLEQKLDGRALGVDEKIRLAAVYWVLSVFGTGSTEEKQVEDALGYLKTGSLPAYLDALNKELKTGGEPHVYLEHAGFSLDEAVQQLCRQTAGQPRPVLVYVDAGAYSRIWELEDEIVERCNAVLVIHDTGGNAQGFGMQILDKELKLYDIYLGKHQKI